MLDVWQKKAVFVSWSQSNDKPLNEGKNKSLWAKST